MQVFAVGRWLSSAGRTVTLGIGWKPSSLAGSAGLDVQKYTYKVIYRRASTVIYLKWERHKSQMAKQQQLEFKLP